MVKFFRWFGMLFLISTLTGCFYWLRAYQTYRQMDEFDRHFVITVADEFNLFFKDPVLYSDDIISLSQLQPSITTSLEPGEKWRYWFRKIDEQGVVIKPEIKFYFDLNFNKEQRLTQWSFPPLFLQIAPAEFLEASLRSIGAAEINIETRQLRANTDLIKKTAVELPLKMEVLKQLGIPLAIKSKENKDIYHYHFRLETHDIEKGDEDRTLTVLKLTFDKQTDELIKMAGSFAGLKISIDYRNYIDDADKHLAQVLENKM